MLSRPAAFLLVLLALPATAAAEDQGAYAGLALSPGAGLGGEFDDRFSSDGHVSARLHGGYRRGPWGFEAAYFGTGLTRESDQVGSSVTAVSLGGKYHLTLGRGLELYVRLGLNRATMHADERPDGRPRAIDGISGFGIDYGTGLSWQSQPVGTARLRPRLGAFLDLGIHRFGVSGNSQEFSGSMRYIQVGFLSSVDF